MKNYFTRVTLFFFITGSTLFAQDTLRSQSHDESDRTAEDIQSFVDGIVSTVQTEIELFTNDRHSSDDQSQDSQTKNKKIDVQSSEPITFNGDTEIAENDTVQGDLVVKNGELTLRGVINGDVLVVNGTILIKGTGRVRGNVRSMNGSIIKEEGAVVEGYTEQSSEKRTSNHKKTLRARYSYSFKPNSWLDNQYVDDNFLFRYNRVEGFFFGFGSEKKFYWDGSRPVSGYGSFGYGITSHKWRLQLGLDRQFAQSNEILYEVGAEAHSLTDTKDEWIMNLGENNLAALLFHEDFRDYFQREGFSIHSARYTKEGDVSTMVDVRYLNDRYNSMFTNARWALFGGREFRSNPLIDEGIIKSVIVFGGVNTVEKYRKRSEGWDIFGRAEYAGRTFGGDYDFSQVIFDLRRYQSISDDDLISFRLRVGGLEGAPITQRIFELGGANTMPAYGFKEFSGNRMVLANLEYQLSGEVIDEVFFWPHSLNFVVLGDAGSVKMVNTKWGLNEGFDSFSSSQVKSDIGFALSWHDGDARLGFAWRTDESAPVAIFFRLNRAF
ncbi:MAG: BamA/TamA family outer membrane protein [Bacteroidota bacterium]|nr:BamA/TamA family outer membrane protein [Bacteroidota bacterium]